MAQIAASNINEGSDFDSVRGRYKGLSYDAKKRGIHGRALAGQISLFRASCGTGAGRARSQEVDLSWMGQGDKLTLEYDGSIPRAHKYGNTSIWS